MAAVAAMAATALPLIAAPAAQATTYGCPTGSETAPNACVVAMRSASGTWTVPAGVTEIDVLVVGGGGGGGGAFISSTGPIRSPGGGGGGGGVTIKTLTVTPGQVFNYTIGAGGTAGSASVPGTPGAAATAGGQSAVTSGAGVINITAPGGGAGGNGDASGAGGGGASALSNYAASPVTYNGGSSLFTTEPATGQLGGAGGGAGAGQQFQGNLAQVGGAFGANVAGASLNAVVTASPLAGVSSGFGGNGIRFESGRFAWWQYYNLPSPNDTYRITHFGAGGAAGLTGGTYTRVTTGGSTEIDPLTLYPGPAGNGGVGTSPPADALQIGIDGSGGGGGGGAARGTSPSNAQDGGAGGAGLVAFAFDRLAAGLSQLHAFGDQAQFDNWNSSSPYTDLSLTPTFSGNVRGYELEVAPATTSLWFGALPLAGGTITSFTAVPGTVTAQSNGIKVESVVAGTTIVTVVVTAAENAATETYQIRVVSPPTPPGPGNRALAWGYGGDGALGDGGDDDRFRPVQVLPGANTAGTWKEIAAGYDSTCAIGTDDRLYCWGGNSDGQLATGDDTDTLVPVASVGGDNTANTWSKIDVGYAFACGIGLGGKGYCWGYNSYGTVGNGGSADQLTPDELFPSGSWVELSAGGYHACGVRGTAAYCWGYNRYGELGDGGTTDRLTPGLVSNGANTAGTWRSIAASGYDTCAIGTDNKAYCWGRNSDGQLGDGTTAPKSLPVAVLNGANSSGTWKKVASGYYGYCAIGGDDKAYCWGDGRYGALGNGTSTDSSTPVAVSLPPSETVVDLTSDGDAAYFCALTASAKVYCWGYNGYGVFGDGTDNDSAVPVLLELREPLTPGVPVRISAGAYHMTMIADYPALPGAPTITGATGGDGSATVTFTPGTAGDSPTTNYEYKVGSGAWTALSPASTTSPITISGLTNGQAELIRIRGVSADGGGAQSNAVSVTPFALPGAPLITGITAQPGGASVAFTAGAAGTSATDNYEYQLDNGAWVAVEPPSTTSPLVISGLTNGTTYSIKVRAVSADGDGAASNAQIVRPFLLPGAPNITEAAPLNQGASIEFGPGSVGTSPVFNYEYQIDGGSWVARSPASTSSPLVISGLTNGNPYSVKIRAVSSDGSGSESTAVSVTPALVPGAPTISGWTPRDGEVELSFTAGTAGSSSTTNYEYQLDGGVWRALSPATTSSPITIGGLTNGTPYSVRLRAISSDGSGAASTAVNVTPGTLPGAPTITGLTPLDGAVRVAFTAGTAGNFTTTNYEYQVNGGSWVARSPASTASPLTITGLTNGVEVEIKLRAVTAVGAGTESTASAITPFALPGAPTVSGITAADGAAVVTFTAGSVGTLPTTNYEYQLDGLAWRAWIPATTASPLTITGLTNGVTYSVRIRAVSADGSGAASNAVSVTPTGAGPDPEPVPTPIRPGQGEVLIDGQKVPVTVTVNEARTRVTLTGPDGLVMNLAGRGVNGAPVPVANDGALILTRDGEALVSGTGMQPGSQVRLYLLSTPRLIGTTTVNANGGFRDTASIPVASKIGRHVVQAVGITPSGQTLNLSLAVRVLPTPVTAPSNVRGLSVKTIPARQLAELTWRAPASSGGAPLTGYVVSYRTIGVDSWVRLGSTQAAAFAMSGVKAGCRYDVRVAARNEDRRGPWQTLSFTVPMLARAMPFGDFSCRIH